MKKLLIVSFLFTLLQPFEAVSQSLNYSDPLPVDQSIKKGVLPNGMTYYIKSTAVVKGAASYYIIQNVGSILENEDQQGLAHFLEHMAFNGTQHFPGKGILNTLQKHGAVFGKDINAYTSFDETVYNLNDIPTKDGLVDTCLQVLFDWSHYLLLTDEEIDAERGVIKEEWRTIQNGYARLSKISFPIYFNHSKYADRLPIGLMSVVENFKYKALRDFYHDWYRTDLQSIAIIGDFNAAEIEKQIIDKFSKIPAVTNPIKRYLVDIPENKDMLFSFGMDPEVKSTSINFGIRHKNSLEPQTVGDLKRSLIENMAMGMLSSRLSEKAQKPEALFLGADVSYSNFTRTTKTFSLEISPKPNKQAEALNEVFTEIYRAVKFGYTQSEINRMIEMFKSSYENQIAKKDDASHKSIENSIQDNYLENKTITDIVKEYEIVKEIFKDIKAEDIHNTLKKLYTKNNRYLSVVGVEGQDNLTEEKAKNIIDNVENNSSLEPYTEAFDGKTLVSDLDIKAGTISKIENDKKVGATTFVLSNGIKVHYKFADKKKNVVSLNAMSYGGTSLLNNEDLPSASVMTNLIQMSGLGNYNATDLSKVLAGKMANLKLNLGEFSESLSGGSSTKDVETMLQMVHLNFVKPRFDADAYKVLVNNLNDNLIKRSADIGEKMRDSLILSIYGKNNPKKRIFDKAFVDAISFDKIQKVYNNRFSDASDFEFFIVGDVKESDLKVLLEKYIASIPTKNTKETFKKNYAQWVSDNINKDIFIAMEDPKASVNIFYKNYLPYTIKNEIFTDVLGDMLQLRVTETVREAEGGAYSPRAYASFVREPDTMGYVSFSFDCNPDMADKLVLIVKEELQKIANGTINASDLNKTGVNFIKEREQEKNNNSYDMQLLTRYFRYNQNIDDPKNFVDIVNSMTDKDIQEMAKKILSGNKSYQIVFKPKINNLN